MKRILLALFRRVRAFWNHRRRQRRSSGEQRVRPLLRHYVGVGGVRIAPFDEEDFKGPRRRRRRPRRWLDRRPRTWWTGDGIG